MVSCSLTGRLPPRRLSHPGTGGPEVANWWPRGGELVAQSAQSCSASAQSCSGYVKRIGNLYRNMRNSLCFRHPGSDPHILPLSCSLTGRLPPRRLSHPGTGGPEVADWWPRGGGLVAPRRLESDKNLSKSAQNLLGSAQDLLGPVKEFQTSQPRQSFAQKARKS